MLDPEFLSSVPHAPGVYLMLDRKSSVLYVGKAKDLAKRLAAYARFSGSAHNKTGVMLSRVSTVDILLTNTEKEALILEASLIKRHRPKYNVILRDDKSFPLIKVTVDETWPRVFVSRRKQKDGARYFGPYASTSAMRATLRLLSQLFPLRRCKGQNLRPRKRPCLNYQMNRCLAPCAGKIDNESYRKMVDKVVLFLEGRNKNLAAELQADMKAAADNEDFERAALYRDQLRALAKTLERQLVVSQAGGDRDVFGYERNGTTVALALLYIRDGVLRGTRRFFLEDTYGDDGAILSQVIKQVYDDRSPPPPLVLLPFAIDDQHLLQERLADLGGRTVALSIPRRGDRRNLLTMANANAKQLFEERQRKHGSWNSLAAALQKKLRLDSVPQRVECLDISTISGTSAVGSLVRFIAGEPDKAGYRRYRITTVNGPDDYAMMREVLTRRFDKITEESEIPDLLVVDGGKGQLAIAEAVARSSGFEGRLDLLGIAKERAGEGEKLYKPGRKNPIVLPAHDPVLLYLMRIRDEAHRFGVTYHRSLRTRKTLGSELDRIPGIGPVKKKRLLTSLGSVRKIALATVDDLMAVDGIGAELARQVHDHFHSPDLP